MEDDRVEEDEVNEKAFYHILTCSRTLFVVTLLLFLRFLLLKMSNGWRMIWESHVLVNEGFCRFECLFTIRILVFLRWLFILIYEYIFILMYLLHDTNILQVFDCGLDLNEEFMNLQDELLSWCIVTFLSHFMYLIHCLLA